MKKVLRSGSVVVQFIGSYVMLKFFGINVLNQSHCVSSQPKTFRPNVENQFTLEHAVLQRLRKISLKNTESFVVIAHSLKKQTSLFR